MAAVSQDGRQRRKLSSRLPPIPRVNACSQTVEVGGFSEENELAIIQDSRDMLDNLQRRNKMLSDLQIHENERLDKYKALYEKELTDHRATQEHIKTLKEHLINNENEYRRLCDVKAKELIDLKRKFEFELAELLREHEEKVKAKEQQVLEMKQTISQTFTGNSWQRQQFLDELANEVKQLHDEANNLRMKKRQLVSSNPDMKMCCKTMALKMQQLEKQIQMRRGQVDILEAKMNSKDAKS